MGTIMRAVYLSLLEQWRVSASNIRILVSFMTRKDPPSALAIAGCPSAISPSEDLHKSSKSMLDSIFDGLLLAVPKHRRSIEKRLYRKHRYTAFMEYGTPKSTIVPCLECGNYREKGHLCKHCYDKVCLETKEMKAKLGEDIKYNVPMQEIEFVYNGEAADNSGGKLVINMNKSRPSWFSKNLLNKTG
ncbi:large ribosomal subunit protein bL32m-like [Physella acuta]|uniref:large ribosomal subunit protein bL32m-like n=1 Tax=Physella acuta TaxID=109671 RepID=UPI0027DD6CA3|nr:large ribosomal subunit protein bL32m-like [Physella acuta]